MTNIARNIEAVLQRIHAACEKSGPPVDSVALLAVTKTVSPDAIREAIAAGQRNFGENYIAEGVEKIIALQAETARFGLQWHCIGPVQSNKTRLVAAHFDWVHSVDRLKTAQRLSEQRLPDAKPLQVCIQVNIDGGPTKSGVAPAEVLALAQEIVKLPRLKLRGLMTIPEPVAEIINTTNLIAAQAIHTPARALFDDLNQRGFGLDTLSIGMSADLEPAIYAGSTLVRVGTAIFGRRT
jgi:pyridoxal phosphate enzyme (YggS family)